MIHTNFLQNQRAKHFIYQRLEQQKLEMMLKRLFNIRNKVNLFHLIQFTNAMIKYFKIINEQENGLKQLAQLKILEDLVIIQL